MKLYIHITIILHLEACDLMRLKTLIFKEKKLNLFCGFQSNKGLIDLTH